MARIPFEELLYRTNDSRWEAIIGDSWPIFKDIIGYRSDQSEYVDFALSIRQPYEYLRDVSKRTILLRFLTEDEARDLVKELGLNQQSNPYKELHELRVIANSSRERKLFSFFGVESPIIEEKEELPDLEEIESKYPLFNHQIKVIDRTMNHLSKKEKVMIHMPTGSGKTRVAMNIVSRMLVSNGPTVVLWLVYNEELCNQAANEFKRAWSSIGNRKVDLLRFYGSHRYSVIEDGVIVASLGKMWAASKKDRFFLRDIPELSLIVFDEAHQSIANTYMQMIDELLYCHSNCNLVGLTATPGRSYVNVDEDELLSSFFDSNLITMDVDGYSNPIDYLVSEGYLSKTKFDSLTVDTSFSEDELSELRRSLDITDKMLIRISKDSVRNLKVVKAIKDLTLKGHKRVIVFTPTVDNAVLIASLLKIEGIWADAVSSHTSAESRYRIIADYNNETDDVRILCNYNILSTGFDSPKTSAVVIARPTLSLVLYSQMVGRAIRGPKVGGTEEAEVLTIVDRNLPGFSDVSSAFSFWESVWNE